MYKDETIRKNIVAIYDPVEMPGAWYFDHVDMLKTIDLYYYSQYKTGKKDSQGNYKFFFNIVKPACDVAVKFIDLDTKDIILIPQGEGYEMKVWFMQRRLREWMRENKISKLINEIVFDLPKYGHVVIKKTEDGWKRIPLHNFRVDPTCSSLKKMPFVYEQHFMSRDKIESMGWNNQEGIDTLFRRGTEDHYLVYECYHKEGKKWRRLIKADCFTKSKDTGYQRSLESRINDQSDYIPMLTLDDRLVDLPYRELKWEDVTGRWLGYGFVEYLIDNQVATNEAENLERKGLAIESLTLLQTRDEAIAGSNILSNTENGDILRAESEVTKIPLEARNLAAFNSTRSRWDGNTQTKTFTYDVSRGENLPSRTPLGVASLSADMVSSYFDVKRENLGIFLRHWITDDIIPDFQEDNSKEHFITFLGSDEETSKLDKFLTEVMVDQARVDYAMKTGFFPAQDVVDDARQRVSLDLKKNINRYVKIIDNFYKDAKYYLDVVTTGEQMDLEQNSSLVTTALQILGSNPAILQNEATRRLFFALLSGKGLSPATLGLLSELDQGQQLPMGGSVAAAAPSPTPLPTSPAVF